MTPDQLAVLAGKALANQQKRLADLFLAAVATPLRQTLSQVRIIVWPESDQFEAHHSFDKHGIGTTCRIQPAAWAFDEYLSSGQVFQAFERLGAEWDSVAGYFRPSGFWSRTSSGEIVNGRSPLFEVEFGWARRYFKELHTASKQSCGITTADAGGGFVTDVVQGHADYNADIPVYRVARWGLPA